MHKFFLFFIIVLFSSISLANLQSNYISKNFEPDANEKKEQWKIAFDEVSIISDWQANDYPAIETRVKSVWSDEYIYFLYIASFDTLTLDENIKPDENGDCWGIWNFDVVEVFIGDNPNIKKYFEFVISPLNQKIDVKHNKNKSKEESFDTIWNSNWQTAVKIDDNRKIWIAEFRIPFSAISTEKIENNKKFRFNLFRCHDKDPNRKYLAMNATFTDRPSFHVPEKFGILELTVNKPEFEPAFFIDFENSNEIDKAIISCGGIGSTNCLDMTKLDIQKKSVPVVQLGDLEKEYKAITVTGWLKQEKDLTDYNHQYLFASADLQMMSHGIYKGRHVLKLNTSEQKELSLWSSWFGSFFMPDRWMFFAYCYDGTAESNNVTIYVGTEEDEIWFETGFTAEKKIINLKDKKLYLGSLNENGAGLFKGRLDNIRIYLGNDSSSVPLTKQKIEKIRRLDVGETWLKSRIAEKEKTRVKDKLLCGSLKEEYYNEPFNARNIDLMDWVFPDIPPQPLLSAEPYCVGQNSSVSFQTALFSKKNCTAKMKIAEVKTPDGKLFKGQIECYKLLTVPIESNNNGGSRTSLASVPPASWKPFFTRISPFEVYEPMIKSNRTELTADKFHSILTTFKIDKDAAPGLYTAKLLLETRHPSDGNNNMVVPYSIELPLRFMVFNIKMPDNFLLHTVYWLSSLPEDLTQVAIPQWWSERHWKLLENSGKTLVEYGQDTMYTPLINGEHPLIQTKIDSENEYNFDFSKFDHWVEMFTKIGFKYFDGEHIAGGHAASPMDVYAEKEDGSQIKLFTKKDLNQVEDWFKFIPIFYDSLYVHLKEKGWLNKYNQCQLDEPHEKESYKRLADIARKHLPGINTKDAINGDPAYYSPLVDIHVFGIGTLASHKEVAIERMKRNKQTWLYHCCSPYPPYPNRHLDEPLCLSRLYPSLAYKFKATGYLFWAANILRGTDPYKTSIGPLPDGSQNPGHPPGDNWMFYPSPHGLIPSLRMVAFREGMTDHTLLMMLAEKSSQKADKAMQLIARTLVDYQRDNDSYHQLRKYLLTELSND